MVSSNSDMTQTRRDWLLKAITVGILAASTMVAWLIVRHAAGADDCGTAVIREIRDKGLSYYWGDARQVDWYLTYDEQDKVVGWQVSARHRRSDEVFEGRSVASYDGQRTWEHWLINDRADEGEYELEHSIPTTSGRPDVHRTTILLKDGKVTMRHPLQNITSEAPAPENYVPRAVLELAYYVTANMGKTAKLATLFTVDIPPDKVTLFGHTLVKDIDRDDDGVQVVVSRQFADGKNGGASTMRFDKTGRVVSVESGRYLDRLSSRESVESHFPGTPKSIEALFREQGMTIGDTVDVETMTTNAAVILAEIRTNGLSHYWPDEPTAAWYLRKQNAGPDRWRATVRGRRPGGMFEGLDMHSDNQWEYWRLNDDATQGRYEAGRWKHVIGSAHLKREIDTKIILAEGRVKLWQKGHGTSRAPTPANYIPEGLVELACYLTAGREAPAQFALIFNSQPPAKGVTRFGHLQVSKSEDVKDGRWVTVRTVGVRGVRGIGFDDTGRRTHEGRVVPGAHGPVIGEETAVSKAEVVKAFDQAPAYVKDLLDQIAAAQQDEQDDATGDDDEDKTGGATTPDGDGATTPADDGAE